MGHNVTVYSDCAREGLYDDVVYINYRHLPKDLKCDIFVSSRQPWALDNSVTAKLKFLWVHDVNVGVQHHNIRKFNYHLCLSKWHKDYYLMQYPYLNPQTVFVTQNGIDLRNYKKLNPQRPNRVIYSSCLTRGVNLALDLFVEIRKKVPDAEFHIFYGVETWMRAAKSNNNKLDLEKIAAILQKIKNTPGVVYHGRVSQKELAEAQSNSKIWLYPTYFLETSCITAMEVQAAGCVPVVTPLAALNETVRTGYFIPGEYGSDQFKDAAIKAVCCLLQDQGLFETVSSECQESAGTFSWFDVAQDWHRLFNKLLS
jgi:glycosyltransferase involved in cell wall biosynthesis